MKNAITYILNDKKLFKEVIDKAFNAVDVDGNGYIDHNELKLILNHISCETGATPLEDEQIDKILKKFDADNNGTIEKNEYAILVTAFCKEMIKDEENSSKGKKITLK